MRKQDRLARPIADKDTGLNNFGIAKKMKKLWKSSKREGRQENPETIRRGINHSQRSKNKEKGWPTSNAQHVEAGTSRKEKQENV